MKIGDYVRTKDGIILKIKDIEDIYTSDNEYIGMAIYGKDGHFVNDVEIIKSDPKLIKLVQVGDYVNGCLVLDIAQAPEKALYLLEKDNQGALMPRTDEYIQTIVTKEQFEAMQYNLENKGE